MVTEFSIGTPDVFGDGNPLGITSGPDGNLWFAETTGKRIGKITTAGGVTKYDIPSGGQPFFIATGPDGNLWFTEPASDRIGRITTGVIVPLAVPTLGNGATIALGGLLLMVGVTVLGARPSRGHSRG